MIKTENILKLLKLLTMTAFVIFMLLCTAFLIGNNFSAQINSAATKFAVAVGLAQESKSPVKPELIYYDVALPHSKKVEASALKCMADNIYYEASNQSSIGKIAVGRVVMNRVRDKRFPASVCGVVYQKANDTCQFSWTCVEEEYRSPINKTKYKESKDIAYKILAFDMHADSFRNIKFYHNATVNPGWASKSKIAVKLEDHTFYSEIQ